MTALLALMPTERAIGHRGSGDFDIKKGRLIRGGPFTYTGAQILDTRRLSEISEDVFSLNLYWDLLASSGGLHGTVYSGAWCDVGHPDGLALAGHMLTDGTGV